MSIPVKLPGFMQSREEDYEFKSFAQIHANLGNQSEVKKTMLISKNYEYFSTYLVKFRCSLMHFSILSILIRLLYWKNNVLYSKG